MALNFITSPAIIIFAPGMANAGRIKHHLRHNLWRENSSIVFVGFQAQVTTGRKIVDGEQKVRIFTEDIAVKAKIFTINGFSAHADQSQLKAWLEHFENPQMQIFLVHGEAGVQEKFSFSVHIPKYLEKITFADGYKIKEGVEPKIEWTEMFDEFSTTLATLRNSEKDIATQPFAKQADLHDRIVEIK